MWLSGLRTLHSLHEDVDSTPGLAQWVKDSVLPQTRSQMQLRSGVAVSCGLSHLFPLAWELPYATDAALKRKKSFGVFFQGFTKCTRGKIFLALRVFYSRAK